MAMLASFALAVLGPKEAELPDVALERRQGNNRAIGNEATTRITKSCNLQP